MIGVACLLAGLLLGEPLPGSVSAASPPDTGCATQVIFDSDRTGASELFLLDLASNRQTQVTHRKSLQARLPDFAPGGQHIVFVGTVSDGLEHLFVVASDGSGLRQITTEPAKYSNPAWSPTGDWIAFEKKSGDTWRLLRVRPDGSDLQAIGPVKSSLFHPSWSPDERRLAVVTGVAGAWKAAVLDLDTGRISEVTPPQLSVGSVKWSPDGRRLAFDAISGSDNFDLYELDLETSEIRRLTTHPAVDARPEWSPDATRLVFHSTRDRGGSVGGRERWHEFEIYILNLADDTLTRLTKNDWFDAHPDWCIPPD